MSRKIIAVILLFSCNPTGQLCLGGPSLHSKRFRLVSEQKKTLEGPGRGFSVLIAREMKREPKNERGEGEGKERNACRQTPRF